MSDHPASVRQSSFSGWIGVAREDITPPVGIYARNWGAATSDVAEGIHRPLTLTCVAFQTTRDAEPLLLLAADLGWWKTLEDEWLVRGGVLEALSLEPARVMIALSHTHAGPVLARGDANKPGGALIEPYLELVRDRAITAARRALATSAQATLVWRYGKCDLATNRDLPEPGGKRIVCGFNAQQPADDTLLVGRITDHVGRLRGTIVNYACHPTTLAWENRLISPDYVGAMRDAIESFTSAPCLFLQGASGDLAPAEQYVGDPAVADSHGRRLGLAALATLEGMLPANTQLTYCGAVESGALLAVWKPKPHEPATTVSAIYPDVELPLKPLASRQAIEDQWRGCEDRVLKERLWRQLGVRKSVGEGETTKMPLWAWRLGDSILIGQPNEAYSVLQQTLRRRLAPLAVAAMNVVNGHVGYLPPREMYGHDIYQVWQTPFAAGSLEILIDEAARVAAELMSARQ